MLHLWQTRNDKAGYEVHATKKRQQAMQRDAAPDRQKPQKTKTRSEDSRQAGDQNDDLEAEEVAEEGDGDSEEELDEEEKEGTGATLWARRAAFFFSRRSLTRAKDCAIQHKGEYNNVYIPHKTTPRVITTFMNGVKRSTSLC